MKLSYAQNLEDYHLDLLFGDVACGTYVDVGGGHPVADNVSFWFYLKGWRGLVVEPQQKLAAAYAGVRPRDTVVSCLAGRQDGEAEFHIVDKLHGLSSMLETSAQSAGQYGAGYATIRLPVRRLDGLCQDAGLATIDFLKIDVEGAEAEVLAGIDLRTLRPRVIVIEAVHPGNMTDAWTAWEPTLLARGYQFAFFDNLNRFYVAEEHAALKERFPAAPAPWDKVEHLWDEGRAATSSTHGDRALASIIQHGVMAMLPSLPANLLRDIIQRGLEATGMGSAETAAAQAALLGTTEFPGHASTPGDLDALLDSDRFRAALGRIACAYDGGHLMD